MASTLETDGLEQPLNLVERLRGAGFDMDRSVFEYEDRNRRKLVFVQDVKPAADLVLRGRRIFCGTQPQESKQ